MHRSRLPVLVIVAATAAACSKHDASDGNAILSQDRTLVARLEVDQEARQLPLPAACGTITVAAQPAAANKSQAEELVRKATDAEIVGNVQEARSLLRRASDLDATNKSAAYHLGLTSEALGDRTAAMTAYCRYLALTPTKAESVEARQRVATLSQAGTRVAAASVVDSTATPKRVSTTTTPRVTHAQPTVHPRVVASAPAARSVRATSPRRSTRSVSAEVSQAAASPAPSVPETTSPNVDRTANDNTTNDNSAAGEVVAESRPTPTVDEPATPPRPQSRAPNRAQSAGIGAIGGAILGAATGRSVKSAVIGAAAGGIFGTMVGGGIHPLDRGSR